MLFLLDGSFTLQLPEEQQTKPAGLQLQSEIPFSNYSPRAIIGHFWRFGPFFFALHKAPGWTFLAAPNRPKIPLFNFGTKNNCRKWKPDGAGKAAAAPWADGVPAARNSGPLPWAPPRLSQPTLAPNAHLRCSDAPNVAARTALELQALLVAQLSPRLRPRLHFPSPQN